MGICLAVAIGEPVSVSEEEYDQYTYSTYIKVVTGYYTSSSSIIVVGWISLLCLCRIPRGSIHSSSLDYLLLISSAGSILLSTKQLIQYCLNYVGVINIIQPLLNGFEVCLQGAFLYTFKDVQFVLTSVRSVCCLVVIILVLTSMSALNIVFWLANSVYPTEQYADMISLLDGSLLTTSCVH